MRRILALTVLTLAIVGCADAAQPGDPNVYARITAETDCAALQAEFDQAMTNAESRRPGDELRTISLAYADAADDRMRDIGCYG